MSDNDFVPATSSRLGVMRNYRRVLREWKIPKPVVLVDTREQIPLPLWEQHSNWIGAEKVATLKTGDYSIEGMEKLLALERKSMADIISSTMVSRERFITNCGRLAKFKYKALLIEATYEDMKTPYYRFDDLWTEAHPNAVIGTLDAIEVKFGIPILYTSRNRDLATEKAASWLSKQFTYWWLEQNGKGRVLIDHDRL